MKRTYIETLSEVKEYLNSSVLVGDKNSLGSYAEIVAKAKEGIKKYILDHDVRLDYFATQDKLIKAISDELFEFGVFTDLIHDPKTVEIQCLTPNEITYAQKLMNINDLSYVAHKTIHVPYANAETFLRVMTKLLGEAQLTVDHPIQVVDNPDLGVIISAVHKEFTTSGNYALKIVRKRQYFMT